MLSTRMGPEMSELLLPACRCYDRETLNSFAKHCETSEPLPEAMYDKLIAARTYRYAF